MIKPPHSTTIPDILTTDEVQRLFSSTHKLSYRVFFFTLYSLGLRLSEGINLKLGDIDADRQRVHIRDSKGSKDRLVPLPLNTLKVLRQFWAVHRHPGLYELDVPVFNYCFSETQKNKALERSQLSTCTDFTGVKLTLSFSFLCLIKSR